MKDFNPTTVALAVGLGVALAVAYYVSKGARAVGAAIQNGAINPASSNNVVNQGVQAVGAAATGNKDFSLGAWLYEATHPGTVAAEDAAVHAPVVTSGRPGDAPPVSSDPATFSDGAAGYQYGGMWGL